ncbi:MAG: WbuC family cupin fold metalloprotein [Thermoanaerobaculum sp.]
MSGTCRVVTGSELAHLAAKAETAPRRRANLNLHPSLTDPIQRFFNCFQPGTYVRPHRHEPGRFELFVLLAGKAGVLLFDGEGNVKERVLLAPEGAPAVEIPGGVVHTLVALAPKTLLFEVKPGPYEPLTDKDFAPWAPPEGSPEAANVLRAWEALFARNTETTSG